MERSQGFKGAVRNLRGIGKGATGVLAQQGVRDQVPGACNIAREEGVPKTLGMDHSNDLYRSREPSKSIF